MGKEEVGRAQHAVAGTAHGREGGAAIAAKLLRQAGIGPLKAKGGAAVNGRLVGQKQAERRAKVVIL